MKLSELIADLQDYMEDLGDVDVIVGVSKRVDDETVKNTTDEWEHTAYEPTFLDENWVEPPAHYLGDPRMVKIWFSEHPSRVIIWTHPDKVEPF
jgi:hypothetical protein